MPIPRYPTTWPESTGTGGRNHVDSLAGFDWNGWPDSVEYAVDAKNQVIVNAEAFFGQGQEHNLLGPTINKVRHNFKTIGHSEDIFTNTKLTADSGYHSEKNMEVVFKQQIDTYIADPRFRRRDPRFQDYDRYKERYRKELGQRTKKNRLFRHQDFTFADDLSHCICPAGKRLYRSGSKVRLKNYQAYKFKGPKSACVPCTLRKHCLRYPERTEIRQMAYLTGKRADGRQRFTEKIKAKIDTIAGRAIYGLRLAVGEPPFAHIRSVLKLDRFTLRGKQKVNTQWNLFCIVHNLKKMHRMRSVLPEQGSMNEARRTINYF